MERKERKKNRKENYNETRKKERNGRKKITPLRGEKEWKGKGK